MTFWREAMPYTNEQKLEALRRELRFRHRVYARKVSEGSMSQDYADEQIAVFEEIARDYEAKAAEERLL